jgi:hypothetical protein
MQLLKMQSGILDNTLTTWIPAISSSILKESAPACRRTSGESHLFPELSYFD